MQGVRVGLSISAILAPMVLAVVLAGSFPAPAKAQAAEPSQPVTRRLIKAPPGFNDTCRRYQWFCTNQATGPLPVSQADLLDLAHIINRRVNNTVIPLTDPENYGVADYWSLPVNGNGDCPGHPGQCGPGHRLYGS